LTGTQSKLLHPAAVGMLHAAGASKQQTTLMMATVASREQLSSAVFSFALSSSLPADSK
jgi:hypothetical protein